MNCIEISNILSKQWANVNDIKIIANCGRDNATIIRDTIRQSILNDGYFLPTCKEKVVPMEKVINYLNINVDFIFSQAEKQLNLISK